MDSLDFNPDARLYRTASDSGIMTFRMAFDTLVQLSGCRPVMWREKWEGAREK